MKNAQGGAGWLLAAQGLFGVLPRSIALTLGFLIVLGMVYCGWRGIRLIWHKG